MAVRLIDAQKVRDITGLSAQAESRKLTAAIDAAQRSLAKKIGLTGYRELVNYFDLDSNLASQPLWRGLMCDYIEPWLAWTALDRALPFLKADISKNGIKKIGDTDGFTGASTRDVSDMSSTAEGNAQDYMDALMLHLKENSTDYSWYGVTVDEDQKSSVTVVGGMILRLD